MSYERSILLCFFLSSSFFWQQQQQAVFILVSRCVALVIKPIHIIIIIQRTRSADSSTMQGWPTPYHQAALGCQAPRLQKKTCSFFLFPSQLLVLQCISSAHSLQPKRRSTSPLLRHIWSGPLQAWRLQQCSAAMTSWHECKPRVGSRTLQGGRGAGAVSTGGR